MNAKFISDSYSNYFTNLKNTDNKLIIHNHISNQDIKNCNFNESNNQESEVFFTKNYENLSNNNLISLLNSNKEIALKKDCFSNKTLLFRFVELNIIEKVEIVLKYNVDVNITNRNNETPLYLAVDNGNYNLVNLLLINGSNPNIQQRDGETPLHIAAFKNSLSIIDLLLKYNSNIDIKTFNSGYTAIDYAREKKCFEAVDMLICYKKTKVNNYYNSEHKNNLINSKLRNNSININNSNNILSNKNINEFKNIQNRINNTYSLQTTPSYKYAVKQNDVVNSAKYIFQKEDTPINYCLMRKTPTPTLSPNKNIKSVNDINYSNKLNNNDNSDIKNKDNTKCKNISNFMSCEIYNHLEFNNKLYSKQISSKNTSNFENALSNKYDINKNTENSIKENDTKRLSTSNINFCRIKDKKSSINFNSNNNKLLMNLYSRRHTQKILNNSFYNDKLINKLKNSFDNNYIANKTSSNLTSCNNYKNNIEDKGSIFNKSFKIESIENSNIFEERLSQTPNSYYFNQINKAKKFSNLTTSNNSYKNLYNVNLTNNNKKYSNNKFNQYSNNDNDNVNINDREHLNDKIIEYSNYVLFQQAQKYKKNKTNNYSNYSLGISQYDKPNLGNITNSNFNIQNSNSNIKVKKLYTNNKEDNRLLTLKGDDDNINLSEKNKEALDNKKDSCSYLNIENNVNNINKYNYPYRPTFREKLYNSSHKNNIFMNEKNIINDFTKPKNNNINYCYNEDYNHSLSSNDIIYNNEKIFNKSKNNTDLLKNSIYNDNNNNNQYNLSFYPTFSKNSKISEQFIIEDKPLALFHSCKNNISMCNKYLHSYNNKNNKYVFEYDEEMCQQNNLENTINSTNNRNIINYNKNNYNLTNTHNNIIESQISRENTCNNINSNKLQSKTNNSINNEQKLRNLSIFNVNKLCNLNLKSNNYKLAVNNEIYNFLKKIKLEHYTELMIFNGFDDLSLLIDNSKNSFTINDEQLKYIGIDIAGDRAKIIIRLEEISNFYSFDIPKSTYNSIDINDFINTLKINQADVTSKDDSFILKKFKENEYIINLENWLKQIKLEKFLVNFINAGYYSLELLLIQYISK